MDLLLVLAPAALEVLAISHFGATGTERLHYIQPASSLVGRGHIDQIRTRVSHRLFLKSIFHKDFRNSLASSVGGRKSKPTNFDPP